MLEVFLILYRCCTQPASFEGGRGLGYQDICLKFNGTVVAVTINKFAIDAGAIPIGDCLEN